MARISLLTLHLAAPLEYSESPGSDAATESLLVFRNEDLVIQTRDSGPRVADPLPQPSFQGTRNGGKDGDTAVFRIQPGDYLFAQWRPGDYPGLAEALEDIARQTWWEKRRTVGLWMVRMLEEDGQTALQCWIRVG